MRRLLINSHVDSTVARDRLIRALVSNPDYSRHRIIIVVGGSSEDAEYAEENVTWVRARHNSIDFTALIEMVGRYPCGDEYMYIHDTCSVGPDFFRTVWNIPLAGDTARVRRRPHKSMNMGLYTQRWIDRHEQLLASFRNDAETNDAATMQAMKRTCIAYEDVLFDGDPSNTHIGSGHPRLRAPEDVYGTGVLRVTEEYPDVRLVKYKANWTTKDVYEMAN